MKIGTKERLLTAMTLMVIALTAVMTSWSYEEIDVANHQRKQVSDIARALSRLRLLSFEYRLYHDERSKVQWYAFSAQTDKLIEDAQLSIPTQAPILTHLQERMATVRRLFVELASAEARPRADALSDESNRSHEAQVLSRILAEQQDNFVDVFRLTDSSTEHISHAQQQLLISVLAGLAIIAIIKIGVSWLIRRDVLTPIAKLQFAAQQVAAGNWHFEFERVGANELVDLSKNFGIMTSALRRSFAQLEHSMHELAALNSELESFSYSVSHDLRGPLRSMDGFALVLLEDYGDQLDEEGKDALKRIRAASQRMGALIDDLLSLSKVTRVGLHLTRVDLSALARQIADDIERANADRSVEWVIEPGLSICADLALMRISMQNLLENAWKFTGRTEKPVIRIGAMQRERKTVFFVADNGAGFDMAHADSLFGAFQRLHHVADFPGTGIGLAIVQRIFRRHDGEIWAEAAVGKGATFFFDVKESHGSHEQDDPAD